MAAFRQARPELADACTDINRKTARSLDAALAAAGKAAHKNDATDRRTGKVAASRGLHHGDQGKLVKNVQQHLKRTGINPGPVDGVFGPRTRHAVRVFQKRHELEQTGRVDGATWTRLVEAPRAAATDNTRKGASASMRRLAANARAVALSMGGYRGQGYCATGVSRAIARTYGISVWGNGNQIDNNLPRSKFQEVKGMSLAQALKTPGLILTWERTSTALGSRYGHTAITAGDGHSSYSDFIETNTLAAGGRSGLKIFRPIG